MALDTSIDNQASAKQMDPIDDCMAVLRHVHRDFQPPLALFGGGGGATASLAAVSLMDELCLRKRMDEAFEVGQWLLAAPDGIVRLPLRLQTWMAQRQPPERSNINDVVGETIPLSAGARFLALMRRWHHHLLHHQSIFGFLCKRFL